ncbi:MAG: PTS glucose transporter subunit IIA [Candidatus Paraimprobicoccus trichonymphae]|uniref:PTS glucose transporter subunit IIA n=1 Tax=Candidatus Paraimprobicoccus trichonymphae TaxID=3033793 RepID=A0AA48KXK6_9FIRM|nr:MAG: PTS glucose transporter subunit IIA [Candidatus Paraimprobicoccus trichonymphae]
MFSFSKIFKNSKFKNIFAPISGNLINIEKIPDEAFSQKMLGNGIGIIPESNLVASPVDGVIVNITGTLHAFGIRTEDNIDVLVHIGIDTVKLKSQGFKCFVKKNQKIKTGEIIAEVDLNILRENKFEICSPVIITNMDKIKNLKININIGKVEVGKSIIMSYETL